jgi:hypothetical protein
VKRQDGLPGLLGKDAVRRLEPGIVQQIDPRPDEGMIGRQRLPVQEHGTDEDPHLGPMAARMDGIMKADDAIQVRLGGQREAVARDTSGLVGGIWIGR